MACPAAPAPRRSCHRAASSLSRRTPLPNPKAAAAVSQHRHQDRPPACGFSGVPVRFPRGSSGTREPGCGFSGARVRFPRGSPGTRNPAAGFPTHGSGFLVVLREPETRLRVSRCAGRRLRSTRSVRDRTTPWASTRRPQRLPPRPGRGPSVSTAPGSACAPAPGRPPRLPRRWAPPAGAAALRP